MYFSLYCKANCGVWNLQNKQARVKDGVVALTAGSGSPSDFNRVKV
jgi:hypothetical protein